MLARRGGLLDDAERAHDRQRLLFPADLEIAERTLRLGPPIFVVLATSIGPNVSVSVRVEVMDLFRKKKPVVEEFQPLPGVDQMQPVQKQAARPLPKVTSPQYYTYKAEPLRRIATAKLVDPVVTGSVRADVLPPAPTAALADARQFLPDVTAYAPADVAKAIETFYTGRDGFVWIDGDAPNAAAKAALTVLGQAASVGLDPQDYAVTVPSETFDRNDMAAREKALVEYGARPHRSEQDLRLSRLQAQGRQPGRCLAYRRSHDVAAYLNSRRHRRRRIPGAEAGAGQAQGTDGGDTPRNHDFATGTLLKPGISSPELANIVAGIRAIAVGCAEGRTCADAAAYQGTPDYTPDLVSLVEGFQKEHGLTPTA
jgi:murein L,D-transpeptidase YcbB/YkuD